MNKLIYFVDDDKMILHLMEYTFSGKDEYTVKSFRRGEDCLASLDKNPDIIILDHSYVANNSQYSTGLEILKEIRNKNKEVDIIILTANSDEQLKKEYENYGVTHFIIKDSFFIDSLNEFIQKHFKN